MKDKLSILMYFLLTLLYCFLSTITETGMFKNYCFIGIGVHSTIFIYELFKKEKE